MLTMNLKQRLGKYVPAATDTHATTLIRRPTEARRGSWMGAAIQKGLQPSGRGIAIAEAVTRKRLVKEPRTL
jgi:hypothetical protein